MQSIFKPVLISVLLATAGLNAFSQAPMAPMGEGMSHKDPMTRMTPAHFQAQMEKRQAALKAKLKLSTAQEADWTTFVAAMKPATPLMTRKSEHDALANLTTPERIDKMKAQRSQHMADMSAAMDKRGEATKAFYAALTPEQKKTFDQATASHHANMGKMHGMDAGPKPAPTKP